MQIISLKPSSEIFLISKFRRVLYVVCFLMGNSPASEFYMPTFRNTLFRLYRQVSVEWPTCLWRWNRQSVSKRRHIKFRRRGITQKKTYNSSEMFFRYDIKTDKRTFKCTEVYCTHLITPTRFVHSCGYFQGGALRIINTLKYYKRFWTNVQL
jgi:hypothetical protein